MSGENKTIKSYRQTRLNAAVDILRRSRCRGRSCFSGGGPAFKRRRRAEIIEYASRFFVTTVYDNGSMAAKKIRTAPA